MNASFNGTVLENWVGWVQGRKESLTVFGDHEYISWCLNHSFTSCLGFRIYHFSEQQQQQLRRAISAFFYFVGGGEVRRAQNGV